LTHAVYSLTKKSIVKSKRVQLHFRYIARLGDLDLYSDDDGTKPETIPLAAAKVHEGYSPINFTNDIAILTLSRIPKKSKIGKIPLTVLIFFYKQFQVQLFPFAYRSMNRYDPAIL
jgi:secreted trypsin-like serine protease